MNSIYHGLTRNNSNNQIISKIQQIKYSNYNTKMKISKANYFLNKNSSLWYFKNGTKNGFKASLQEIEAGF